MAASYKKDTLLRCLDAVYFSDTTFKEASYVTLKRYINDRENDYKPIVSGKKWTKCPICGKRLSRVRRESRCPECGRKMNWEGIGYD